MSKKEDFEHRVERNPSTGVITNEFVTVLGSSTLGLDRFLKEVRCSRLMLNYAHGWNAENLNFLRELQNPIEELIVIAWTPLDLSPISALTGLREITLHCHPNVVFNFELLPSLEECTLTWAKGYSSVFGLSRLKRLWVDHLDVENLDVLCELSCLESLKLLNTKARTLDGLEKLKGLKALEISHARRLKSIEALWSLSQLRVLELQAITIKNLQFIESLKNLGKLSLGKTQIGQLDSLARLPKLRWLDLSDIKGGIPSIAFVRDMQALEILLIFGTRILEDDLSVLLQVPSLRYLRLDFRKRYFPSEVDFEHAGLMSDSVVEAFRSNNVF
jgi:Leucine-rich repeat (LRR) protein